MPSKKTDESWVDELMEDAAADDAVWGPQQPPETPDGYHRPGYGRYGLVPIGNPFAFDGKLPATSRRVGTEEDLQKNQAWRAALIADGHFPQDYIALIATSDGWVKVDIERREADELYRAKFQQWAEARRLAYRGLKAASQWTPGELSLKQRQHVL